MWIRLLALVLYASLATYKNFIMNIMFIVTSFAFGSIAR